MSLLPHARTCTCLQCIGIHYGSTIYGDPEEFASWSPAARTVWLALTQQQRAAWRLAALTGSAPALDTLDADAAPAVAVSDYVDAVTRV